MDTDFHFNQGFVHNIKYQGMRHIYLMTNTHLIMSFLEQIISSSTASVYSLVIQYLFPDVSVAIINISPLAIVHQQFVFVDLLNIALSVYCLSVVF